MSKVAFRSKQLDFHKPVPIYWSEELAELSDPSVVTRAIPYIPSGMEKEEESEQHLQWALSTQEKLGTTADSVIPIPEVETLTEDEYTDLYRREFKLTKHLIRIQTFGAEQEYPDYDLDLEDEKWLAENGSRFELTPLQFESMIDRLEKGCGQQVVQLAEAKALLKEDDDLTTLVYNYWLGKRLRLHHALLLHVKTDKRDGISVNDPYVAFRRRAEKMQTRKNRKSDELSYERMVKLKRDCSKLVTLLELIRRREKSKKELIQLAREIFGKRYELNDFDGRVALEAEAERMKDRRPAYMTPKFLQQQHARAEQTPSFSPGSALDSRPLKRHLVNASENLRLNKRQRMRENGFIPASSIPDDMQLSHLKQISKAEHITTSSVTNSTAADLSTAAVEQNLAAVPTAPKPSLPPIPDGRFAFKRMAGAIYLAPHSLRNRQPPHGVVSDSSFTRLHVARHGSRARFCLTSIHTDPTPPVGPSFSDSSSSRLSSACVGYARLRRGRGGSRLIIDRAPRNAWSQSLNQITDWQSESPVAGQLAHLYRNYIQNNVITHYSQYNPIVTNTANSSLPAYQPKSEVNVAVNSSLAALRLNGGACVSHSASSSQSPSATLRPNSPNLLSFATTNIINNQCNGHGSNNKLVFPTPMITLLSTSSASSSTSPGNPSSAATKLTVPSQTLPILDTS